MLRNGIRVIPQSDGSAVDPSEYVEKWNTRR